MFTSGLINFGSLLALIKNERIDGVPRIKMTWPHCGCGSSAVSPCETSSLQNCQNSKPSRFLEPRALATICGTPAMGEF